MMKQLILTLILFLLSTHLFAQDSAELQNNSTTLVFVRHAEKMSDETSDPSLNILGKERAVRLAKLLLEEYQISGIYSTPYKRTLETAGPISDSLGFTINEYDLKNPKEFITELITKYRGGEVLIVGHSNTTPMLVNLALGTNMYDKLDENSYDNLFVITVLDSENIAVQRLSY